ncbi:MAG: hypothetical protein UC944_02055 [Anaerovibrio sp.]|nr:hypothetical protein [Veillonellaceae bacterium]MEE0457235.1 hypothetical protein [Anaerovibrio sp.]
MSAKKIGGRPAGRRKTQKIEVLVEPSLKAKFMALLSLEGKTASNEIGQWIRAYIKNAEDRNR